MTATLAAAPPNSTLEFLRGVFREFYFHHRATVETPPGITEREFGYMPFGGTMVRHLMYGTAGELLALLVKEGPANVYCSAARYEDPTQQMEEKGWRGADLIFDIDADAIPTDCKRTHDLWRCKACGRMELGPRPASCPACGSRQTELTNLACSTCLGAAKERTGRLLDFLQADFGIASDAIAIHFSGNIGYHVTVADPAFHGLDQLARSDIADYVAGVGLLPEALGISRKAEYADIERRRAKPSEPGWRGRMARAWAGSPAANSRTPQPAELPRSYARAKKVVEQLARQTGVGIDAGVTTDVHRIFRLGGTLHGKTGLLKQRCVDLAAYDPLVEAVALDAEPVDVAVALAPRFALRGQSFGPYRSETIRLPTHAAVYLLARGLATVS